ncbi:MAG: M23 family metallopeptidase [Actinomycetota bacterium]|nr:M23 family metallopeptidase [Actinomycetota bacterium]
MDDKKHKSFTLVILSDAKSRIRKIKITHNLLRLSFVALVVIMASVVILVSDLFFVRQELNEKVAELERVKYKVNYKEVELANLEKRTKDVETKTKILESYMEEVEDLDRMVRSITGKGGYEEEVEIYETDLSSDIKFEEDPNEIYYYVSDQEEGLDDIDALLDDLLTKAPELSEILTEDKKNMEDYIYLMEHTPSMWPTWGTITSLFGERRRGYVHKGLDIANNTGTSIQTTASGTVIFTGWHGGYGRKIIIYHGFGYTTVYAHLSKIYVEVGDKVKQGDIIGTMGNTGHSTGSHLHYEVLVDGIPNNPMDFLPEVMD